MPSVLPRCEFSIDVGGNYLEEGTRNVYCRGQTNGIYIYINIHTHTHIHSFYGDAVYLLTIVKRSSSLKQKEEKNVAFSAVEIQIDRQSAT